MVRPSSLPLPASSTRQPDRTFYSSAKESALLSAASGPGLLFPLPQWLSKFGPWTSSNKHHLELVRNANSQAPPQTC